MSASTFTDDWRGIVVTDLYRADGAFHIAKFVEDNARQLAFRTAGESHNFSHDWTIKIRDLFKDVPSDVRRPRTP